VAEMPEPRDLHRQTTAVLSAVLVVLGHGLLGATTVLLVLAAALRG